MSNKITQAELEKKSEQIISEILDKSQIQERQDGSNRHFQVTVPNDIFEKLFDFYIEYEAQTFKLAGFRVGAVPLSLIKNQRGKQLKEHCTQVLMKEVFHKIATNSRENLRVLAVRLEAANTAELVYHIETKVLPTIPKMNFADPRFTLEELQLKVTSLDIMQAHRMILQMLNRAHIKAPEGYESKNGDIVVIDFYGLLNGEEFSGNKATELSITVGSGAFIPDFEAKLVGVKAGDDFTTEVRFPSDYHDENLSGKEVDFQIKVHDVMCINDNAKIDTAIAEELGASTVEQLDEMITQKIKDDFRIVNDTRIKGQILDKLNIYADFEIPSDMIDEELQSMVDELKKRATEQDDALPEQLASIDSQLDSLREVAVRRVRTGLLFSEIAQEFNIRIEDKDFDQAKASDIARNPDKIKEIENAYKDSEMRRRIYGVIMENQILDTIRKLAPSTLTEVTSIEFAEKYAKDAQIGATILSQQLADKITTNQA